MNKELIYICFVCPDHLGVVKKIEQQVNCWKLCGKEVTLEYDICDAGILKKYIHRYFVLIKYFVFNFRPNAKIYMRQTISLPLFGFLTRRRVFSYEVNADLSMEANTYTFLRRLYVEFVGDVLLRTAKKVFFVSGELSRRYDLNALSFIFPNALASRPSEKNVPRGKNIVFVGNSGQQWQGVDLLFDLICLLPDYQFHLIGEIVGPDFENVTYHGVLNGSRYSELMSTMDYAVGTLAFFRSGLTEGSPLKVRDYVSFNLPTIVGYVDSDFSESEFLHLLEFDGVQSIDEIKKFLLSWENRSIDSFVKNDCLFLHRESKRITDIFS